MDNKRISRGADRLMKRSVGRVLVWDFPTDPCPDAAARRTVGFEHGLKWIAMVSLGSE